MKVSHCSSWGYARLPLAIAAALAIVLEVSAVRAQSAADDEREQKVEELIYKGVELLAKSAEQNAAKALRYFEQADAIKSSPRTLGQRGVAEQWLERWAASEEHLSAALAAPDHPWVAKNKPVLETARKKVREHLSELVVSGTPEGAEVWVKDAHAGRTRGTLPLREGIWVTPGRVDIQLQAAGYQPRFASATLEVGTRKVVPVALEKIKLVEASPLPADNNLPDQRQATESLGNWRWWTLVGGGAAALIGGGLYAAQGSGGCGSSNPPIPPGAVCHLPKRYPLVGLGIAAAGLGAATYGGIKLYSGRKVEAAIAVGLGSLQLGGRF